MYDAVNPSRPRARQRTRPDPNRLVAMTQVTLERAAAIAILKIDRPPANAMTVELLDEIVAALRAVELDLPGALVITGREGFFSAGVDLKEVPRYGPAEQRRSVEGI